MFDQRFGVSYTYNHGGGHGYGYPNFANKERKLGQNYVSCSTWLGDQDEVQFRPNHKAEAPGSDDEDAGYTSPPLWQNSPSPARSPSQPLLSHHVKRSQSPSSRVQTIIRGKRELMEMVKNMPESSFELSLKDLVEHNKMENQAPPPQEDKFGDPNMPQRGGSQKSDKNVRRSGSFEHKGLFLKMGFPVSLQKRSNFGSNNGGKVSPKPVIGERDWWKKKFTGSSDSDSSRTSNTSGSTRSSSSSSGSSCGSGRKKNGFFGGCWPCFLCRRSKYT